MPIFRRFFIFIIFLNFVKTTVRPTRKTGRLADQTGGQQFQFAQFQKINFQPKN
jgi:hypothetical protein